MHCHFQFVDLPITTTFDSCPIIMSEVGAFLVGRMIKYIQNVTSHQQHDRAVQRRRDRDRYGHHDWQYRILAEQLCNDQWARRAGRSWRQGVTSAPAQCALVAATAWAYLCCDAMGAARADRRP